MRKRYAIVGMSHRAMRLFVDPMNDQYSEVAKIVAFMDIDQSRMDMMNKRIKTPVETYLPEQFDEMVAKEQPEVVVVASTDATHHTYVIAALKHDLDVWCEKPLTTDAEKACDILKAEMQSKGKVNITFNYRYSPFNTELRKLLQENSTGKIVNMDFSYYLDTYHGSSYFMRWNRKRANSGGLCTHKCTHHFDLIQWWINQKPVEVFAYGGRSYYGAEGPGNPSRKDGRHCPVCDERKKCSYYMRWHADELRGGKSSGHDDDHVSGVQSLSHYENHEARRCIYDSEIDIEDYYNAVIKYDGGTVLSYSLNASAPFEGFRLGINGLKARLETERIGCRSGVIPPPTGFRDNTITVTELFGATYTINPLVVTGSHGGADPLMRDDLFFGRDQNEPVNRSATLADGVLAVLVGVAMRESIATGKPVLIKDLLGPALSKTIFQQS